jgi:hypothetical protein
VTTQRAYPEQSAQPEIAPNGKGPQTVSPPPLAVAKPLSRRAIVLTLFLVAAIAFLTPYVEFVLGGTQVGALAPSGNAILPFLILALLVNPVLKRLNRRWELPRRDLIGIYSVLLAGAVLTSCQFSGWIVPVATGPFYYATPENHWRKLLPLIPTWWRPGDYQDIRRFYDGPRTGEVVHWAVWWKPLLAWGPFVLIFYMTFLCVTVLLRKVWIEQERLSFPLVQLPLEMTGQNAGPLFFRNRLMWLGMLIPVLVHGLNGLHNLLPSLPSLPTREFFQADLYFTAPSWKAILPFTLDIYFCLIGFAYLASSDVPFSMWVFYLLFKASCVLGAALGWTPGGEDRSLDGGTFPYIESQHVGAMLAMVGLTLWTARTHLRAAIGKAFGRRPDVDDRDEPLSYRMAVCGVMLGFALLVFWCWLVGMPVWVATLTMLLSLLFVIGMHRMMAEGGVNFLWAAQNGTNYLLYGLGGASFLSAKSWLVLVCLPFFFWDFKGPVGPQSLDGFKLQREANLRARSLIGWMVAGMALAMLLSYWSVIYLVHSHGGGVALDFYRFVHVGQRPFTELTATQTTHSGSSLSKLTTIGLSALFTWFLGLMRLNFVWWRLHPVGYAASSMWAMYYMWFSLFLGATARWLLTRFGGLQLYRQARGFFLGLVLGDFLMLGVWLVVDMALGIRGYSIF